MENVDRCTPLMVACGIGVASDAANEVAGEEPDVLQAAELLLKLGAETDKVLSNDDLCDVTLVVRNDFGEDDCRKDREDSRDSLNHLSS